MEIEDAVFRLVIKRGRRGRGVSVFENEREDGGYVWLFQWREKDKKYLLIFKGWEEGRKRCVDC